MNGLIAEFEYEISSISIFLRPTCDYNSGNWFPGLVWGL